MAPRIVWDGDTPREIVNAFDPILRDFADAFPGWIHEVRCGYDSERTDGAGYTRVNVEYRFARINFCGGMLEWDWEARRRSILHEIVHASLQPFKNLVDDIVQVLPDLPESIKGWANEQLRMVNEGATCDVTAAILRLIERRAE